MRRFESPAVSETQLVHDVHRRATSLLSDATNHPSPSLRGVAELRDFVAATLDHHHHSEDRDLWPLLIAAAPELSDELARLSAEHDLLARDLDALRRVHLAQPGDLRALRAPAQKVRDRVHEHLAHEEPVLFPAMAQSLSDQVWAEFSQRTVTSAPTDGLHLLAALFDEVGTPSQVDLILRHVPAERHEPFRAAATRGRATLAAVAPKSRERGDASRSPSVEPGLTNRDAQPTRR